MPEGSLLISVLRDGHAASCPNAETVLQAGDEILAVLDPRVEEDLTAYFGPDGCAAAVSDRVDFLIVGGGMAGGLLRLGAAQAGRRRARSCSSAREPEPPYERPPLSKEYLRGEA